MRKPVSCVASKPVGGTDTHGEESRGENNKKGHDTVIAGCYSRQDGADGI
jgi:hypothetical protein